MNAIIGVASYNSNVNDYIMEYLTSKDVIYFEYISQIDFFVSSSSKEALNSILDELSSNLKRNFDTELLRFNSVFERYYSVSERYKE